MAATEQLIWTAIPNGISGSDFQISVCVSPTLAGGATGTLTDFNDFQNWPELMSLEAHVHLKFYDNTKALLSQSTVAMDTPALNNALWLALFSPPADVRYAARDAKEPYTTTPVVSYPSDQIASFLESSYASLATASPTSYPSLQQLGGVYGDLGYANQDVLSRLKSLWQSLSTQRLQPPVTAGPGAAPYANNWTGAAIETAMAALRFYHMPSSRLLSTGVPAGGIETIDFHRALTFINQHPALQRALGLVFDVTIPISEVDLGSGSNPLTYVQGYASNVDGTIFNGTGVSLSNIPCYVQCDASATVFQARASSSQIVGRQLTLGDTTSFAIYEIDVDGGGLKTAQFADNLALAREPQSADGNSGHGAAPDAPTSYAPPSLRSSGLTVAAINRGLAFVARLQRQASLMSSSTPSTPPTLTAEDLVRGYVLDVYDAPAKAWHSTAMRNVTYTANPGAITLTDTDEQGLDSPPRSQTDPTTPSQSQLNLPANIIRWTGWSNAAPRPGTPLPTVPGDPQTPPFPQLAITITPTPGSLPRLRFGTQYALRARVVDIANNVIPLADGAPLGDVSKRVSPLALYGRHEPVGSPDIYTWNQPLPGESLKHMVIRDIDSSPSSVRAFAPNRVAELFAELHGEFDTSSNGATTLSPSAYSLIVAQEDARYPLSATTTPSGTPLWNPISLTSPVPFLPDPLSRGGNLQITTGPLTGKSQTFDFTPAAGLNWPNSRPYGIEIVSGASQTVTLDATKRQMTFALAPGDSVMAQLSSYVNATDFPALGMYNWISKFYGGAVPAAFQANVTGGLTWAMTPWTMIELIHAVQKPLLVPKFSSVSALKELGWTYAQLFGDVTYSPKSTARIELLASWGEPVDNGADTGVPQGPGSSHTALAKRKSTVFTIPSSLKQENSETDRFEGRHEFFDTKHRVVGYTGKATSAFTEHYQGDVTITVPAAGTPSAVIKLPGKGNLGLEPGSVVVSNGSGKIYQENTAFTVNGAAGTITFEAAPTGPAKGSTVTVDFLPAVSVDTPPTALNIRSSARPLSPDVEFIVPIYKWSAIHHLGHDTVSRRSPSALRVFLSRPWWSSGIGEKLGVTVLPTPSRRSSVANIPNESAPYVSDWGLDPVFRGGHLPTAHPYVKTFTKRVGSATKLKIDENASVRVDVAAHDVFYDADRDLWYSDIVIDFGNAYTPMVRLALARYQRESVSGVELSRIVLADIMSLEPGRTAVVVRKSATELSTVSVIGNSYSVDANQSDNGPGLATVVVERRDHAIHDETLGWVPVGEPIKMSSTTDKAGTTIWTARNIKLPTHGPLRLWIGQYEVIPDDPRNAVYVAYIEHEGLRLAYQDIVPL
jgi:hypothetical protein